MWCICGASFWCLEVLCFSLPSGCGRVLLFFGVSGLGSDLGSDLGPPFSLFWSPDAFSLCGGWNHTPSFPFPSGPVGVYPFFSLFGPLWTLLGPLFRDLALFGDFLSLRARARVWVVSGQKWFWHEILPIAPDLEITFGPKSPYRATTPKYLFWPDLDPFWPLSPESPNSRLKYHLFGAPRKRGVLPNGPF